jgi:hypothetical protein
MDRLLAMLRDELDRAAADASRSDPEWAEHEAPDPYGGAPLGVECAWPEASLAEEDLIPARH